MHWLGRVWEILSAPAPALVEPIKRRAGHRNTLPGHGVLTLVGKQEGALSMFNKGRAFMGAAFLLAQAAKNQGDPEYADYVALQNLCQSVEVTLKGLLLLKDYDNYKPRLKKIGHDLTRTAKKAI